MGITSCFNHACDHSAFAPSSLIDRWCDHKRFIVESTMFRSME